MADVCNIGRKGILGRFLGGILVLALVVVALYVEPLRSAPALWRIVLVIPLFVSFLLLFQAREST